VRAGARSLDFCEVAAEATGGGLRLVWAVAAGARGVGVASAEDCLGGGARSSVGPERMLAKDMGSAALVGFTSLGGEDARGSRTTEDG
jgi:hypothetical protein